MQMTLKLRGLLMIALLVGAIALPDLHAQAPPRGKDNKTKAQMPEPRVAELITTLRSGTPNARAKAAETLGEMGPSALSDLLQALRTDGKSWRSWGAAAMAKMGPKAIAPMVKALNDNDEYVRLAIITALGEMGPIASEATPTLQRLSQVDSDDRVRAMAKVAINQINRK